MLLQVIRSAAAYQLLDQSGRLVGTVVQPAFDQVVGRGAGTVLLTRAAPRRQRTTPAPVPVPTLRRISGAIRAIPTFGPAEPAA